MNILHVEDSQPFARLILEEFKDIYDTQSFIITHVTTLEDALALVNSEQSFVVILLDLSLPDAMGFEALEEMHKCYNDIPIIVLSGAGQKEMGLKSLALGAQDYLMKNDCSGELLHKTIQYAIERHKLERQQLIFAMTDSLTMLPNRAYFLEHIASSMGRAKRSGLNLILFYIDFDGFKSLNDTYGHNEGDNFLREVGKRFIDSLRESDFCARLGGDEFAVLIETEHSSIEPAAPFLEKLLAKMREPFHLATQDIINSSCSMGGTFYTPENHPDKSINQFMEEADKAMYHAKGEGGDCYRMHEDEKHIQSNNLTVLQSQFKNGIKSRRFFLEYQPIVQSSSKIISGLECLLRLKNDKNHIIPPSIFIGHLENSNLICQVGKGIIEDAVDHFITVTDQEKGDQLILSINISPHQVIDPDFLPFIKTQLKKKPATHWLNLEISEVSFSKDIPGLLKSLTALRALGIKIAINDFGLGSCNIMDLFELPIDIIKLDKSFSKKAVANETGFQVAKTLFTLAKSFNKSIIAAGVENENTWKLLTKMGADLQQGYYFGRPQSIEDILIHLISRR